MSKLALAYHLKTRFFLLCCGIFSLFLPACAKALPPINTELNDSTLFSVLQFNVWQEGTMMPDGYTEILAVIERFKPELIALSEVRNYHKVDFMAKIQRDLQQKGLHYYTDSSYNVGILSRYPIAEFKNYQDDFIKAVVNINGLPVAFYSLHIDYTQYAEYLPRGYNVTTYQKLEQGPIRDADKVLKVNNRSKRDEQTKAFLAAAQEDLHKGFQVIVAGDFNEPSFLDWTEETQHMWEHNGAVIPWTCSKLLYKTGFKDSYRVIYPNVKQHPGFTWVVNHPWIDTDERDRIDFIYYFDSKKLKPIKSAVIGPQKIYINKHDRVDDLSKDLIAIPQREWPSDHRAVWTVFQISD